MATAEAAYKHSLHATIPEMAATLQALVGQRLVAFVTGSRSNKTVARWASGDNHPQLQVEAKLRDLYRTVLILQATEPPDTIRAWMTSANPYLGDEVPAEVLREGNAVRVFHAAQAFIED
jgi:Protein of unknown function (DUF2384)